MTEPDIELLNSFVLSECLQNSVSEKRVILLGKILDQKTILILEKTPFQINGGAHFSIEKLISAWKLLEQNDIYSWHVATLLQSFENPAAKATIIVPATEAHIRKYRTQKFRYVTETPALYDNVVKPYIDTQKGDRIQWVYNILFHGKEAESVIYHDKDPESGFVLLPDMKWDKVSMDALYLIAIVNRMDVASVRDLNESHLAFLKNLNEVVKTVTVSKFPDLERDQLRVFIHYQPSYYHFHVHIVNIQHPGLGSGINAGKAILLDDVIGNIELVLDYYQRRTLSYVLGENHDLWKLIEAEQKPGEHKKVE